MSFPAPPPIGLDTMGEVHDLDAPDVLVPEPGRASLASGVRGERAPLVGSALLGLAAGHRSMAPLAALALAPPRRGLAIPAVVAMLALAELVVDKLPAVPARTRTVPLLVRALSGAIAGGFAAHRARRSTAGGAAVGGASAIAATGLGLQLRLAAEDSMPRVVAALVEDALAISMALAGSFLVRAGGNADAKAMRLGPSPGRETIRVRVSG